MKSWVLGALAAALLVPATALAKEGMWLPDQVPQQSEDLIQSGLQIPPQALSDLTGFPLGAVVSLRWCTGSFVSPNGLIATNHHCIQSALQRHSNAQRNLLKEGYLARSLDQELAAGPSHRALVTVAMTDVTEQITRDLPAASNGAARRKKLSENARAILNSCRADPDHACAVHEFFGGHSYYLIKQLELRDVRLVYAPHAMIGRYGGDDDNWRWPRQTGDFAFLRAYVSPDGDASFYKTGNVPYQPKHYLKIAETPVQQNDFTMVLGYPGQTERYRIYDEARYAFQRYYPAFQRYLVSVRSRIEEAVRQDPNRAINLATQLDAVNNTEKRIRGMLMHARRSNFLARKAAEEGKFVEWINASPERNARYMPALDGLRNTIAERFERKDIDFVRHQLKIMPTLASLYKGYNQVSGRAGPDAIRRPIAEPAAWGEMANQLKALPTPARQVADRAILKAFLSHHADLPQEERLPAFGRLAQRATGHGEQGLDRFVNAVFDQSAYGISERTPESLSAPGMAPFSLGKSAQDYERSDDPMMKLAVTLAQDTGSDRAKRMELAGREQAFRSRFMEGWLSYANAKGGRVYPDANNTLRLSYGRVKGVMPADGKLYVPFTTLDGVVEKHTGVEPFDAPDKVLSLARRRVHGPYRHPKLRTVPVNTLTTLDITGGSSGSPVLNAKGELTGFLFDGMFEGLVSDWRFDPRKTRSIYANTDYLLWTLTYVEDAKELLKELGR